MSSSISSNFLPGFNIKKLAEVPYLRSDSLPGIIGVFKIERGGEIVEIPITQLAEWKNTNSQEQLNNVGIIFRSEQTGLCSVQTWQCYFSGMKDVSEQANISPFEGGTLLESLITEPNSPILIRFNECLAEGAREALDESSNPLSIGIIWEIDKYVISRSLSGRLSFQTKEEYANQKPGHGIIMMPGASFNLLAPCRESQIINIFQEFVKRESSRTFPVSEGALSATDTVCLQSLARPESQSGRLLPLCRLNPTERSALYKEVFSSMSNLPCGQRRKSFLFSGLNGQDVYYYRSEANPNAIILLFVYPAGKNSKELPPFGIKITESGCCSSIDNKVELQGPCEGLCPTSSVALTSVDLVSSPDSPILSQLDAVLLNRDVLGLFFLETQLKPLDPISVIKALISTSSSRYLSSSPSSGVAALTASSNPIVGLVQSVLSPIVQEMRSRLRYPSLQEPGEELSIALYNPNLAEQDSLYTIELASTDKEMILTLLKRTETGTRAESYVVRKIELVFPKEQNAVGIKIERTNDYSIPFFDDPFFRNTRKIMINLESPQPQLEFYAEDEKIMVYSFVLSDSKTGKTTPTQPLLTADQVIDFVRYVSTALVRVRSLVGHPNSYTLDDLDRVVRLKRDNTSALRDANLLVNQGPQSQARQAQDKIVVHSGIRSDLLGYEYDQHQRRYVSPSLGAATGSSSSPKAPPSSKSNYRKGE